MYRPFAANFTASRSGAGAAILKKKQKPADQKEMMWISKL
jgi:hypothetical protein